MNQEEFAGKDLPPAGRQTGLPPGMPMRLAVDLEGSVAIMWGLALGAFRCITAEK